MFGDIEVFRELCAEARKHNIRIMLDGVFSHTGSDSIYFNKEGNYPEIGAYQSRNHRITVGTVLANILMSMKAGGVLGICLMLTN